VNFDGHSLIPVQFLLLLDCTRTDKAGDVVHSLTHVEFLNPIEITIFTQSSYHRPTAMLIIDQFSPLPRQLRVYHPPFSIIFQEKDQGALIGF
jgi:hypothetical protein